jgi:hypothetical protein
MALLLAACSTTVPVHGLVQNTSEVFTGTTTGYADGSGSLTVVSNKGASCVGDFVYVTNRTGEGVFRCSDGRSGPFQFASAGVHGTGQGSLGKDVFTFTFGD